MGISRSEFLEIFYRFLVFNKLILLIFNKNYATCSLSSIITKQNLIRHKEIDFSPLLVTNKTVSRAFQVLPPPSITTRPTAQQLSPDESSRSPASFSYASVFLSLVKILLKVFFTKSWTPDKASRRLDNLKTSLITTITNHKWFEPTPVEVSRGRGVGFPSLEGALLSLAFLTFSVFLIDLIQTLLAKLRLTTPTTTAAPVRFGRTLQFNENDAALPTPSWREHTTSKMRRDDVETMSTLTAQVFSSIERPFNTTVTPRISRHVHKSA